MQRIKLSKNEKTVLRLLMDGNEAEAVELCNKTYAYVGLSDYKLVRCALIEGREIEAIKLTWRGQNYVNENPRLRNPINWAAVASVISMLAIIALGCSIILK